MYRVSNYSIRDIEQLSGIKAHTIRIWEQRYNFIEPKRTETNIRFYNDEDLKLILNISLLKENGFKISRISKMASEDLKEEVQRITDRKIGQSEQIQALTIAMLELDENRFEKIITTNILQIGFERTVLLIIVPFFKKVGILWQTGAITPAHEHFISNLTRQKIIVAIDGQVIDRITDKKFLLFLPEGELHEISLLISSYLIKTKNHKVIYLGQNLPFKDLKEVYQIHQPQYLLSVFTSYPYTNDVQSYINKLSESFPKSTIFLTGLQLIGNDFQLPKNIRLLNKLEDLITFLDDIDSLV